MSVATAPAPSGGSGIGILSLRYAWRELRGGLRGFYVFIACIALGVAAIAAVGSAARSLSDGLGREGRVLLGGDVAYSLIQREATDAERAFLATQGRVSSAATMRAMARSTEGRSVLVELKAVDGIYPLFGQVVTDPPGQLADQLALKDGVYGGLADPTLMTRFGIPVGARLAVGAAIVEVRGTLTNEPDKIATGVALGPRLLINQAALEDSNLVLPGSLVRWTYRVQLANQDPDEAAPRRAIADSRRALPEAGWEVRTRTRVSPQLERSIERFTQYLTLVGLTALLVGGVGVANAAKFYIDRKRDVVATMKTLGASGTRVFTIYLVQVLLLALLGVAIGLAIGAAAPYLIAFAFGSLIPLPFVPHIYPDQLVLALAYGVLIAIAFALWPLGRAHDVPVSALFRGEITQERTRPRKRYIVATAITAVLLCAFAVAAAYDRTIAIIFIASSAAGLLALRAVAALMMDVARRAPRVSSTVVRLAIANIHRPGALTPTVVLSLGLGLALLVTVLQIDFNLRRQFTAALPAKAPSFYFIDIPASDSARFDTFIRSRAPDAALDRVPMLRGRIVRAAGTESERIRSRPDSQWALQGDRGITFSPTLPPGARLVEGEWWPADYDGPPLVSFEKRIADGLGLKIGDDITVNVLGRNITARIANMRELDWQSLGINFVLVFSPGTFRGAPVTHIATLTFPGGGNAAEEAAMVRAVSAEFPTVTTVQVKDAIETVGSLVSNLVLGVRGASAITLIAAVLVLGGALAAGHRHRVYDSVILKTLGATRTQLVSAYALEYALIGVATAIFGVAVGSVAAWRVVVDMMSLGFEWQPWPALAAAFGALVVAVTLGLLGTIAALGRKPAPVLRNL
jgi:putative ABC transport system permease protein